MATVPREAGFAIGEVKKFSTIPLKTGLVEKPS